MKISDKKIIVMVDIQDASTGGVCLPNQAFPLVRGNTLDILCNLLVYSVVTGKDKDGHDVWADISGWHVDGDIRQGKLSSGTIAGDGYGNTFPAGLLSIPMYDLNSGMFRMGRTGDRYSAARHGVPLLNLFNAVSASREASTITTVKAWEAIIPRMYIIPKGGGGNVTKHIPGVGARDMVEAPMPMILSPWRKALGERLGIENEYDEFDIESRYSSLMLDIMNTSEDRAIYISPPGNVVPNVQVNLDDFVPPHTYNTLTSNGNGLRVRSEMSLDFRDPMAAFDCNNRDRLTHILSSGEFAGASTFTI